MKNNTFISGRAQIRPSGQPPPRHTLHGLPQAETPCASPRAIASKTALTAPLVGSPAPRASAASSLAQLAQPPLAISLSHASSRPPPPSSFFLACADRRVAGRHHCSLPLLAPQSFANRVAQALSPSTDADCLVRRPETREPCRFLPSRHRRRPVAVGFTLDHFFPCDFPRASPSSLRLRVAGAARGRRRPP
jgi:hypothetical protein